jgi:quercetin 2,3-dioxygenase
MIIVRRASERIHSDFGWLDSWHTFSFGDHYDAGWMGFRNLRVINDDTVAAGGGFPTHGHKDMEIISYVLDGALGHKDSLGTGSVIKPGDVQRMSAGTGVRHSEMNAHEGPTHFLQIWILPDKPGHAPGYEQKTFPEDDRKNRLRLVASGKPRDGSIALHADADMFASVLDADVRADHALGVGRHAWVHVARGAVRVNGTDLAAGDGVAISDEQLVRIEGGVGGGEVLLFDLP